MSAEDLDVKTMHELFDGSEPELIEAERRLFEADAKQYGFDLTRHQCAAPEPWSEYASAATGHRWGGWLAARATISATPPTEPEAFALYRNGKLAGVERSLEQAQHWVDAEIRPLYSVTTAEINVGVSQSRGLTG